MPWHPRLALQNAQHQAILAFIQPDETALSLIQRLKYENVTTGLRFLDQQGLRFKPGTTFEIAGPPGSGKTLLLLQVSAGDDAQVPNTARTAPMAGWRKAAEQVTNRAQ